MHVIREALHCWSLCTKMRSNLLRLTLFRGREREGKRQGEMFSLRALQHLFFTQFPPAPNWKWLLKKRVTSALNKCATLRAGLHFFPLCLNVKIIYLWLPPKPRLPSNTQLRSMLSDRRQGLPIIRWSYWSNKCQLHANEFVVLKVELWGGGGCCHCWPWKTANICMKLEKGLPTTTSPSTPPLFYWISHLNFYFLDNTWREATS